MGAGRKNYCRLNIRSGAGSIMWKICLKINRFKEGRAMAFDRTRKKKIKTGTGPGTGIVLSRWCYKTGALFLLMIQHAFCDSISLSTPVRVIAELGMNESKRIKLSNGEVVELKLLQIDDMRDSVRHAVRAAYIRISIDGEEVTLNSGN